MLQKQKGGDGMSLPPQQKLYKALFTLNFLDLRERLVMLYMMSGDKQHVIANRLNVSRSQISRIESKAKEKIKVCLENKEKFIQSFKFDIVNSVYKLVFSSTDINLAKTLQNLVFTSCWHCNIYYDGNNVTIRIPRNPEYFWYIAELINEIDNYKIEYQKPSH